MLKTYKWFLNEFGLKSLNASLLSASLSGANKSSALLFCKKGGKRMSYTWSSCRTTAAKYPSSICECYIISSSASASAAAS